MVASMEIIPRIWADVIRESLEKSLVFHCLLLEEEKAEHEQRMAEDPAYALSYAENETESYWDALYENSQPETEEDEDEW